MIIREKSNIFKLLFAWKGTILPKVMPSLAVLTLISTVIAILTYHNLVHVPTVPVIGFTIFGVILSIFLGFRNNACYDRWWEGRKLWGTLIATARHLDRDSQILSPARRERVIHHVIVFANMLRDRLRHQTAHPEQLIAMTQLDSAAIQQLNQHLNAPQYTLSQLQMELMQALKSAEISDILYSQLNQHIIEMGKVQAGCDRIASTPLPFAYSVLLNRTVYCFCFILPFSLGSILGLWTPVLMGLIAYLFLGLDSLSAELEEPFGTQDNDLPLDSIVRLIERELLDSLGKSTPAPIQAEAYKLL
ncbi:bestrophin family protein [Acinetobacter sp. MD2(2019)]|uniref:bestrophin family protein n=1 Tax=Acinetobacter sp. MD2(2019) TaxID=2605273 RepID=UPI002D1F7EAC|nr:bestrophin family protein [Acinetobacter sp. MD2(2019)]MEB3754285.1 bestrophin family protein [Acinetobacter sp. MD2(2019)]